MKRIIITAILTLICAVGAATSFVVNDLPNYGEWMKTNEQQFRKPPKHDGPDKHMDKRMNDDRHMDNDDKKGKAGRKANRKGPQELPPPNGPVQQPPATQQQPNQPEPDRSANHGPAVPSGQSTQPEQQVPTSESTQVGN